MRSAKSRQNKTLPSLAGQHFGYTIMEVMIFLAVTAAIFAMMVGTFSGRQRSNEFSTAVRELEAQIRDIANDVSSGYYSNSGNFKCTLNAGKPEISAGSAGRGENQDCLFIGKVMQFSDNGTALAGYNVYSVAGARLSGTDDVANIDEAHPTSDDLLKETRRVPVGLKWAYTEAGGNKDFDGVGFFTTFSGNTADNYNKLNTLLFKVDKASPPDTILTKISNLSAAGNKTDEMTVCFDGDAVGMHAVFRISSQGLTKDTEILSGSCI